MTDTRNTSVLSVSALVEAFEANSVEAAELVVSSYRAGDRAAKAAIRTNVTKAVFSAFDAEDYETAKSIKSVMSDLTSVSEKPEIDYNVVVGTKVANYLEAVIRLMSGEAVISGLPDGTDVPTFGDETDIQSLRDMWDNLDIPAFDAETVERLTTVKTGRKSRENDIPDMVREAFQNVAIGTFYKVSEIRTRIAANHPNLGIDGKWDGRINAALFTNNDAKGVEGVESVKPGHSAYNGKNGAIKVESDVWDELPQNG